MMFSQCNIHAQCFYITLTVYIYSIIIYYAQTICTVKKGHEQVEKTLEMKKME